MKSKKVKYTEMTTILHQFYKSLSGGFDDFYEGELLESDFHLIYDNEKVVAFCAIKANSLTAIYVLPNVTVNFHEVFKHIITKYQIAEITFTTNDLNMINEVIENEYHIEYFAVNFVFNGNNLSSLDMIKAEVNHISVIRDSFGDFLENYDTLINENALYLYFKNNELLAMVNANQHRIDLKTYSLGVIVSEKHRGKGIGTLAVSTIANLLIEEGKTVHAGCWYYNFSSKKMMEKAGFKKNNILCKTKIEDKKNNIKE